MNDFQEKCLACYILLIDQTDVWLPLLLEMLGNMYIVLIYFPALTSWILKLTLSFLSSRSSAWPKSENKNLNILRTKGAFKVK